MGMWLFLFTELILFGGMFIIYAVYRFSHPAEFHLAAQELDTSVGMINTIILLTSSMTMAMAITAIQKKDKILSMALVSATLVLAFAFLVNKFFEWSTKFSHGIYPGSTELMGKPPGEVLYFGLYFVMTGLHALHVMIGMGLLAVNLAFIKRGIVTWDKSVKLETAGLYWHLVDLIWIFLFPLFYLIH
ncbi:MAG TPA: cytochrome c oxidase subunit 3 family protein [Bacteroidota bacterium]|nr:cytochrome c oxidase subunit 3 family protein [Bacteroidota bacterium]